MIIPKNHFWSAWVNFNGTWGYVRDYSYHKAIKEAGYRHVQADEMPLHPDTGKPYYYSNEIFANITEEEPSALPMAA